MAARVPNRGTAAAPRQAQARAANAPRCMRRAPGTVSLPRDSLTWRVITNRVFPRIIHAASGVGTRVWPMTHSGSPTVRMVLPIRVVLLTTDTAM